MLLGHYGVAFAAKRVVPRTSLGTTVLAAQLLDELWPIFLLLGIEKVRIVPGLMAANPLDFVSYPYTHSLVGSLGLSVILGIVYYLLKRDRRTALIVGALVFSHWVLDLPMHRPDLQLWPGSSTRVGLGAWHSIPLTIFLELVVFVPGLAVYLRATGARDGIGSWALWAMVVFLLAIFFSGFFSAPPPSPRALAFTALGVWLFVPWSYWIDRHRYHL